MSNVDKDSITYQRMIKRHHPPIPKMRNFFVAFAVGGGFSIINQFFQNQLQGMGMELEPAGSLSTVLLIFLGAFLTGLGLYDRIVSFAGAGALVPVTGFANAMVAPAMEYKQEGYILGMGAKMFQVAGPVFTYGIVSGFFVGLVAYLTELL